MQFNQQILLMTFYIVGIIEGISLAVKQHTISENICSEAWPDLDAVK